MTPHGSFSLDDPITFRESPNHRAFMSKGIPITVMLVAEPTAILSGLAIPLWLLGAPGIDNDYACVRFTGLQTLIASPVRWSAAFLFAFVRSCMLANEETDPSIGPVSIVLTVVIWTAGAALLWLAFQLMASQP